MKPSEKNLLSYIAMVRPYLPEITTIIEIGARDCKETLLFHKLFPSAHIYAFECNPDTLPLCRERIKGLNNIILIEKAVTDENGTVAFYPIDTERTITSWSDGNPGASSLLKASGDYPLETYAQKEIRVAATTLKNFVDKEGVTAIDLMWMDIQGAELKAFIGMGETINRLRTVHVEVGFFNIYTNQPQFKDIKNYLNRQGFIFLGFTNRGLYAGDAVFIRGNLIPKGPPRLSRIALDRAILSNLFIRKMVKWFLAILKSAQ